MSHHRSPPSPGNLDRDEVYVGVLGEPPNRDVAPLPPAARRPDVRGMPACPGRAARESTCQRQPARSRHCQRGGSRRCVDEELYVMPWERPPAWLYPRPDVVLVSGDQAAAVEWPRRSGSDAPAATGETVLRVQGDGGPVGGAEASGSAASGGIRGHGNVLGASSDNAEGGFGGAASTGMARIRGPIEGLGPRGNVRRSQQERLAAQNAHIARSLEDHAERVERKRRLGIGSAEQMTPQERLAAIRRRITQRKRDVGGGAAPHGFESDNMTPAECDLGGGGGGDDVRARGSTEDRKIHYDDGRADEEGRGSCPAGRLATARQQAAEDHAASRAAWHSRGRGGCDLGAGHALK